MTNTSDRKFKKIFMKGQIIFREGSPGNEMYIIESGRVRISIKSDDKKSITLNTFGPNEFFGEMSLFDENKRTASAIALENTSVIVITGEIMDNQLDGLPSWFVTMFKALIERLRSTNLKLLPGAAGIDDEEDDLVE